MRGNIPIKLCYQVEKVRVRLPNQTGYTFSRFMGRVRTVNKVSPRMHAALKRFRPLFLPVQDKLTRILISVLWNTHILGGEDEFETVFAFD